VAQGEGVACGVEGLVCYPQYPCGVTPGIATCTCTGGFFACVDTTGQSLEDGAAPRCTANGGTEACPSGKVCPPMATCPATEAFARVQKCTEVNLMCAYPSTCAGARDYDICQCVPVDAGALQFVCPPPCDYDAALVEFEAAAPPDAGRADALE